MVRAPDCGSGGCGFDPRHPPHLSGSTHWPVPADRRRQQVSTIFPGRSTIEESNGALDRGRTQVHVALRGAEILMPG